LNEWFCFWVELCAYRLIRMKMYTAKAIRAVKTGVRYFMVDWSLPSKIVPIERKEQEIGRRGYLSSILALSPDKAMLGIRSSNAEKHRLLVPTDRELED